MLTIHSSRERQPNVSAGSSESPIENVKAASHLLSFLCIENLFLCLSVTLYGNSDWIVCKMSYNYLVLSCGPSFAAAFGLRGSFVSGLSGDLNDA